MFFCFLKIVSNCYFDFLASINDLTKKMIDTKVENNMMETLNIDMLSTLSIAEKKGLKSPMKINNVIKTAMCETILFSFFTPLFINVITIPKKTGISAVIGLYSLDK